MSRVRQFSNTSAEAFSENVWNLYEAMAPKFGPEPAWEFVLSFYKGAGNDS